MDRIYCKRVEKNKNRIIIPKWFIEKYGRDFYMTIRNDEIILKPINNKKGE